MEEWRYFEGDCLAAKATRPQRWTLRRTGCRERNLPVIRPHTFLERPF